MLNHKFKSSNHQQKSSLFTTGLGYEASKPFYQPQGGAFSLGPSSNLQDLGAIEGCRIE